MSENVRESFRIGPEAELEAELSLDGRTASCAVINLSAGGAKVVTTLDVQLGVTCTLRVRIPSQHVAKPEPFVEFRMQILEASSGDGGGVACRLRNVTAPGSAEYERAAKLVFDAQRQLRARETGRAVASPMVSDPTRRRDLHAPEHGRFSRGSMRPDQSD